MNIAFKEVVCAWCYALLTLVALSVCIGLYLQVSKEAAYFALVAFYLVGVFLTYRSKDNPECHGLCRKKLVLYSMLWPFVLLLLLVFGSVFYLVYYNSTSVDGAGISDIL